jgi:hypothetical protein
MTPTRQFLFGGVAVYVVLLLVTVLASFASREPQHVRATTGVAPAKSDSLGAQIRGLTRDIVGYRQVTRWPGVPLGFEPPRGTVFKSRRARHLQGA